MSVFSIKGRRRLGAEYRQPLGYFPADFDAGSLGASGAPQPATVDNAVMVSTAFKSGAGTITTVTPGGSSTPTPTEPILPRERDLPRNVAGRGAGRAERGLTQQV